MEDKQITWSEAITTAKSLVNNKKNYQMKIASIAMEVCEIRMGGYRKKNGVHTLKRFSKEIGISTKTVSNWVAIYKSVYLKSPYVMREQATFTNLADVSARITKHTREEDITRLLKEEMGRKGIDSTIIKYTHSVRALLSNTMKTGIWDCDMKVLEECRHYVSRLHNRLKELSKHKTINATNHGILSSRSNKSFTPKKAFALDAQFAKSDVGDIKINENDKLLYTFLRQRSSDLFTPTELGQKFKRGSKMAGKLAVLRSLEKLVTLDLVNKNQKGQYWALKK